jgi:hypothetical protein
MLRVLMIGSLAAPGRLVEQVADGLRHPRAVLAPSRPRRLSGRPLPIKTETINYTGTLRQRTTTIRFENRHHPTSIHRPLSCPPPPALLLLLLPLLLPLLVPHNKEER